MNMNSSVNLITLNQKNATIIQPELHLPVTDDLRLMFLKVESYEEGVGGFCLWGIELACLDNIDDLDGKRIHSLPSGETYDDDTLGTDIIGVDIYTDTNCWFDRINAYGYGEILIDFKRIEGRQYHVHVEMTLTESDDDPAELSPEAFNHRGSADFVVEVDENDPYKDSDE